MEEIKFSKEDIDKFAFNTMHLIWVKITDFVEGDRYPVKTGHKQLHLVESFTSGGLFYDRNDVVPQLIPEDHPSVKKGKIEIPIPPPPRRKIVVEPGWYFKTLSGNLIAVQENYIFQEPCEVFEIKETIVLVEGDYE